MTYPSIPLSEVLTHYKEYIEAPEPKIYPKLSVKLYGKGVVLDEPADGTVLKMRRHQIAKAGQVILSEIWGKKGAIGFVPPEGDGALCTSHFFLFDVDENKLDPRYLQAIFTANYLETQLNSDAKGTTGYAAVRPKNLLAAEIPLPSLDEQRRIVAYIEDLATQIEEARGLRKIADNETSILYEKERDNIYQTLACARYKIGEIFDLINGMAFKPEDWETQGRKIIRIQNLKYPDAQYNYYSHPIGDKFLVQKGDVLFAWSGQIVSLGAHIWLGDEAILNQHIYNIKPKINLLPRFVQEGFNALIDEMKNQVRGLEMFHIRKAELNQLLFPVPSIDEQTDIVSYLDTLQAQIRETKYLQAETAAELDALLPSILDKAFRGEL